MRRGCDSLTLNLLFVLAAFSECSLGRQEQQPFSARGEEGALRAGQDESAAASHVLPEDAVGPSASDESDEAIPCAATFLAADGNYTICRWPTEQPLWIDVDSPGRPSFTDPAALAVCRTTVEGDAAWTDLSDDRQAYYESIGWNRERWDRDSPQDREISYQEFNPRTIRLSVPALEDVGFDRLGDLLSSHRVMVVGGTLVGDDEFTPREYMPMSKFLEEVRAGSTMHYLKYDPEDEAWRESIQQGLGIGVLDSFLTALDGQGMLPGKPCGGYKPGHAWTFWVGAAGTITGMHYDDDDFAFLYVTEGRKRVVVIPNDERTLNYTCETYIKDHSCWTGIDVLNGPLPPHAVDFVIGPGEGIFIPTLAWHSVMNLEPTIAFGVFLNENDFC